MKRNVGIGILSAAAIVASASVVSANAGSEEKFLFHTGKNLEKTLAPSSEAGLLQIKSEFGLGLEGIDSAKKGFVGYLGAEYQFPITSELDDQKISLSFGIDGSYAFPEDSKNAKAITASSELRYGFDSDYGLGSRLSLGYGNIEQSNFIGQLSLYAGYSEQLFGLSGNFGIASSLSLQDSSTYSLEFLGFLVGKYAVPVDIESAVIFSGLFAGGVSIEKKADIIGSLGVAYQFNPTTSLALDYNITANEISDSSSEKFINTFGVSLNINFEV